MDRPAISNEFIRVLTSAVDENGAAVDPTVDPVALAFISEGDAITASSTFVAGTWETNSADPASPLYYARVLAGPAGAYIPTAGTSIDIYIKVTDSPEVPVRHVGTWRFT
jgi:hypothetical protein